MMVRRPPRGWVPLRGGNGGSVGPPPAEIASHEAPTFRDCVRTLFRPTRRVPEELIHRLMADDISDENFAALDACCPHPTRLQRIRAWFAVDPDWSGDLTAHWEPTVALPMLGVVRPPSQPYPLTKRPTRPT